MSTGLGAGALVATGGLDPVEVYVVGAVVLVIVAVVAALVGRQSGHRALSQRLTALGSRLGIETPADDSNIETALSYLEQVTGAATEAVADTSADAIRLRRSLDTLPQGVVLCDESGRVVYRNARANSLMTSRHGDALAAQAVTELLEDAWDQGTAERTLDLYGPPRRTLTVRARLIDDGRRPLGVIAMIEDVSERRRLEEIRRDFVANVSHELKTPMGALGLLAETLVAEPDSEVARRLASRIQTEAFRVSRIIDDLLDLSRIESEEAPPREPVLANLVMAEAVERVRAAAEQRGITIVLSEPDPPVAVLGDRRQLVSAMHALLENAVTYSYDGRTVSVSGKVAKAAADPSREPAPVVAPGTTGLAPVASTVIAAPTAVPSPVVTPLPSGGPVAASSSPVTTQAGRRADGTLNEGDRPLWHVVPPIDPAGGVLPARSVAAAGSTAPASHHGEAEARPDATPAGDNGPYDQGTLSRAADSSNGATATRPPDPVGEAVPPPGAVAAAAEQEDARSAGDPRGDGDPEEPVEPDAGRSTRDTGQVVNRDTVRLTVVDHGVGIPARDLDRIFERFYRVDHGRSRETGGTGLGLSIVRHVANNHQGWVEVESREGEGSTFTLVLPLQPDRPS